MQIASKPADETARLATLHSLSILDTPPEERFDRITRLARRLFDVPIAVVSLVDEDRQWFKSHPGLDATQTSRDV
ncbi:MAG: GGDEF domain-containing protein, partial [Burkholderia vietnamiensis]|nr:GGDEF domain-containing protein [Burkholderia vietnamiensis]